MTIDDLPLACTYWLQQNIEAQIPLINAKIAALYTVDQGPKMFDAAVVPGEITVVNNPAICVWADNGSQPVQLDMNGLSPESWVGLLYTIRIVLPKVADGSANTVSNFELSKQCALGGLGRFFWDKRNTLQPAVYSKFDPDDQVTAIACSDACGRWRSVHLKPLADEITLVRSVEMAFTFKFGISDDTVLSSP